MEHKQNVIMCTEHSLHVAWFLAASPMLLMYPKFNQTDAVIGPKFL